MTSIARLTPAVALFALATACSDSTSPPPTVSRGLSVVQQPSARDTITARPLRPLVVEVRDTAGVTLTGLAVDFDALVLPYPAPLTGDYETLSLATVGSPFSSNHVIDTTDSRGLAAVSIRYSGRAGPAGVIVSVDALGLVDTVMFTLDPGAPVRILMLPFDTAIMTGGSIARPRSLVLDRLDNHRSETATMAAVGSLLTPVAGNGFQSGSEVGETLIIGEHAGFSDTMRVVVVPEGMITAHAAYIFSIAVANTDGSAQHLLPKPAANAKAYFPTWSADGQSVIHRTEIDGIGYLHRTSIDGSSQTLLAAGANEPNFPVAAPDGEWVYFGAFGNGTTQIWRTRLDGTVTELTDPPIVGSRPTISRDGNLLAFVASGPSIHVRNLSTGLTTPTGQVGRVPKFSPVDDRIAFVTGSLRGDIAVMNADGSGFRIVAALNTLGETVAWSPDGKWLFGWTDRTVLVNVETGEVFTLPWTGNLFTPAWRP